MPVRQQGADVDDVWPSTAGADRLTRALGALGLAALAWALVVLATGGGALAIGRWRVSSTDALRPLVAALVLLGMAVARRPSAPRELARSTAATLERRAPAMAALTAAGVCAIALIWGVNVAAGSDSFGYVSQSAHWLEGRVALSVEPLTGSAWPLSGYQVAPLGYGPARTPGTLGYTYSPGVPWLMALMRIPFGEAGPYLVTPIMGALAIWLCFVYVRQRAGGAPGLAAAWFLASSPVFLFQMMWAMSDVPVTAAWLAVLVRLPSSGVTHALTTGLLMALALLIRPNLALVAGAVWLATAAAEWGRVRSTGRVARLVALAAPVAVAAGMIAALNTYWWGSPLRSGYGTLDGLFAWGYVAANFGRQIDWLIQSRSWPIVAGLISLPYLVLRGPRAAEWRIGAALVLAVWLSYIAYGEFTDWWYLRFQLPSWPILGAAASVALASAFPDRWRTAGTLAVATVGLVAAFLAVQYSREASIFNLWWGEQRYVAAGEWLRDETSPSSVVLAMQHSGSVGYYGGRALLRYEYLSPEFLGSIVESLRARGRPVYAVFEDWEEAEFRRRYADSDPLGRLDWPALAVIDAGLKVRIYELPGRFEDTTTTITLSHARPWARLARSLLVRTGMGIELAPTGSSSLQP